MLRRLASSVAGLWRGVYELLRPRPEEIQLLAIRGDTPVGAQPVQAGATHAWRETLAAGTDGVLLVLATATVEHGTGPLDDAPDTNVELALFVDGARIARAVETVRRGDDRTIACSSPIVVRTGAHEVRATLRPERAGIRLGDATVAGLFVPESQATIVLRR